jgi:hypothetical protein
MNLGKRVITDIKTYETSTYRVFHLKRKPNYCKRTHSRIKRKTEFLQLYPVVAADALLEIGMAVMSAVLQLNEHLSQTNTSSVPKLLPVGVFLSYSALPCQNAHS